MIPHKYKYEFRRLWWRREELLRSSVEAVKGTVQEGLSGCFDTLRALLFSEKALNILLQEEESLRREYADLVLEQSERWRRADALTVGGLLALDGVFKGQIPERINAAYHSAYPDLAVTESFADAVRSKGADELPGFLAGVKGKLFELEYVDHLNGGILQDGYVAELASRANQPGWDIAISGPDGHVASVLQLKATDSVSYVRAALERYPEIDVVTTDEVYSQLLLSGGAEGLVHSGLANADLTSTVHAAVETTEGLDFRPPLLGLALIGLTTIAFEPGGLDVKAKVFGRRAGQAYPAWLVGKLVAATCGPLWWLAIPAGFGVRHLAVTGQYRKRCFDELLRRNRTHKVVLSRYRPTRVGYWPSGSV